MSKIYKEHLEALETELLYLKKFRSFLDEFETKPENTRAALDGWISGTEHSIEGTRKSLKK
jgi:hypothetical protein